MNDGIARLLAWIAARAAEDNTRAGLNGLVTIGTSTVILGLVAFGLPVETWFDQAEAWIARTIALLAKVGFLINAAAAMPNVRAVLTAEKPPLLSILPDVDIGHAP